MPNVLLIGESWTTVTTHIKGFDHFSTVNYEESAVAFLASLRGEGWTVDHLPAHRIGKDFPDTPEELSRYDAVVISDVGSNSFLLPSEVFIESRTRHNALATIASYVRSGGAVLMVGGYMSFTGIEGKARYGMTALADVLPVHLLEVDDRIELPEGGTVSISSGTPLGDTGTVPALLGYNRTRLRAGAQLWATINGDPLIAVSAVGTGRSGVFTSDLAPHWASPEFVSWDGYGRLWTGLLGWLITGDAEH